MKHLPSFFLSSLFFGISLHAENVHTPWEKTVEEVIDREMKNNRITGLSISVIDDKNILYAKGFGYADAGKNVPATPETIYRAGSISKLFTAAKIMQLHQTGQIDIDKPLNDYLPSFSMQSRFHKSKPITPRMVLSHHAGLPTNHIEGMWDEKVERFSTLIDHLRTEYVISAPDTSYLYSNIGYSLLGSIIESVSNGQYEKIMQKDILLPLGMDASYFDSEPPAHTKSYDEHGKPSLELSLRDIPAGGLNTTVNDLAKFARIWLKEYHNSEEILSSETMDEMVKTQNLSVLDSEMRVGLGWHFYETEKETLLLHDGSTINHNALLVISPLRQRAVVILSNTASAQNSLWTIAQAAMEIKKNDIETDDIKTSLFPPVAKNNIVGTYASKFGLIRLDGDNLKLCFINDTVNLIKNKKGYYVPEYRFLGIFKVDLGEIEKLRLTTAEIGDRTYLISQSADKTMIIGKKIIPNHLPSSWKDYLGTYHYCKKNYPSNKLFPTKITLSIENDTLIVRGEYDKNSFIAALEPQNDNEAIIVGMGRGYGDSIVIRKEKTAFQIRYSGLIYTKEE